QEDIDPAELDGPAAFESEPLPQSYLDVLALIGRRRDAKLKVLLEEHVSLVKFDGATRSLDLYLYPKAPRELPNELREKLNEWTGMPWVVVLSKTPGERPVAQVRREENAAELERLKAVDSVKQALNVFPDAEIVAVTDYDGAEADAEEDDNVDDRSNGVGS
ncbi:MAG: DNA polymerase III subunit gamma/tau, partial [Pseudomonadota bacterium]